MKRKPPLHQPPLLRQPPPPRLPSGGSQIGGLTDSELNIVPTTKRNEDEEDSVIDVPKRPIKVKSRPYYLRRCKRLNFLKTDINSLPDEIVFDILVHLPAQDIYVAAMSVCLKWYQMIHTHKFVNAHLHCSTYGLLIQSQVYFGSRTHLTFIAKSQQGRTELTRLSYKPRIEIIWCGSCNGLILESEHVNSGTLYITNPITQQHFALPRFFYYSRSSLNSAIAYASVSMEYKVVRVYKLYKENEKFIAILTVGVDESWRLVCTQHLSLEAKKLFEFEPLTTEGFVHWVRMGNNYVLTLNVETEIITEYVVPSFCLRGRVREHYCYFPTVKYLSVLIQFEGWKWEVWEMKPETGEWTRLPGIELKDIRCEIIGSLCERNRILKPVDDSKISIVVQAIGWLEYKELLVYLVYGPPPCEGNQVRICFVWNIRLKEIIEFFEVGDIMASPFVHKNSLLWLDGCK
ncbi:hypothetical protein CASFOL_042361 [Castilleja foliolosa]|uniref:F-box domain-containing protein n=1 Tax=Castilleja foliolosa TaxID=1961234 RepID=A0ABD3BAJ6_9LAMI